MEDPKTKARIAEMRTAISSVTDRASGQGLHSDIIAALLTEQPHFELEANLLDPGAGFHLHLPLVRDADEGV